MGKTYQIVDILVDICQELRNKNADGKISEVARIYNALITHGSIKIVNDEYFYIKEQK